MASPEATSPPPQSMDNEMLELMNEYFYGVRKVPENFSFALLFLQEH
jgi:hypothetical protein